MLLELHTSFKSARELPGARNLFGRSVSPPRIDGIEPYPLIRKMRDEWELLELWPRCHPLSGLRRTLRRMKVVRSGSLRRLVGRRVRLVGIAAAGRTTRTEGGKTMAFLTLSDEEGLFEVTLFPGVYRRARRTLSDGGLGPFVVEGRVEEQYGAVALTAEGLELMAAYPRAETQRRRDVDIH
jgi:DNA polymerase-3 subunit alpha